MFPVIRLYVHERPDVKGIRLRDAYVREQPATDSTVQLFPDKRNNFSFYTVRDGMSGRLCEVLVADHPEVDRRDVSFLLEEGSLLDLIGMRDDALPSWFVEKLRQDRGIVRFDEHMHRRYVSSFSDEQESLRYLLAEAGMENYAEVLLRTRGRAHYVVDLSVSAGFPTVDAFVTTALVAQSVLKYQGFLSVDDPLHESYVGQEFRWQEHFEAHWHAHRKAAREVRGRRPRIGW